MNPFLPTRQSQWSSGEYARIHGADRFMGGLVHREMTAEPQSLGDQATLRRCTFL